MAVERELPYGNQHFRVDLGSGDEGIESGFSHVVLPDIAIDVVEYRVGNSKETGTHKLPGLSRYANVILRRGIIGSPHLHNCIRAIRKRDANPRRTLTIKLL